MIWNLVFVAAAFAFGFGLGFDFHTFGASGPELPLRVLRDVPLPGGATRLDYESLDPETGMLFIAHLGDGTVIAFDTKASRVVATIEGTPSVRGVLVVPQLHRVYAAAQGTDEVVVIDEGTLKIVARIKAGDVDGLAFDPATQRVFVSDEAGRRDVAIDTATNRIAGSVELGGEAGNTVYDSRSGHILVAVQTSNELVEIDPQTLRIVARHALDGCSHGHGIAVDAGAHVAYVACEYNSAVVAFDLRAKRLVDKDSVGFRPDVLAVDAGLRRLYVAAESGIVTVFDIKGGRLEKIGQSVLGPNAHVVGVDSATHRVYFPLRDLGGRPVLRIAAPVDERQERS